MKHWSGCVEYKALKDEFNGEYPTVVSVDLKTGIVADLAYLDEKGRFHNENGPAFVKRDRDTGQIIIEEWWWHGEPHRSNGRPSYTERDAKTGMVTYREWWSDGWCEKKWRKGGGDSDRCPTRQDRVLRV